MVWLFISFTLKSSFLPLSTTSAPPNLEQATSIFNPEQGSWSERKTYQAGAPELQPVLLCPFPNFVLNAPGLSISLPSNRIQ